MHLHRMNHPADALSSFWKADIFPEGHPWGPDVVSLPAMPIQIKALQVKDDELSRWSCMMVLPPRIYGIACAE